MLREVRGLGTLVPEDIRWIRADGLASGTLVIASRGYRQADSISYGTERPDVAREALDAEFQLKGAKQTTANLKVEWTATL